MLPMNLSSYNAPIYYYNELEIKFWPTFLLDECQLHTIFKLLALSLKKTNWLTVALLLCVHV